MLFYILEKKARFKATVGLIAAFWLMLAITPAAAQRQLTGRVTGPADEPLPGATLQWADGTGAVAEVDGSFVLPWPDTATVLAVSFVGFQTQVIRPMPGIGSLTIALRETANLETVEVNARRRSSFTSLVDTRQVEHVSSLELRKAPCCSLGESFETNASVDASYSDPLTGVREIQMLGLRGVYTQLLMEKRPTMTGLASPYGMDLLPGPWVESIQISKGAASVQSGAGSLTGQINTELIKPMTGSPLYVNLFGSTMGRGEANVYLNQKLTDKWSSGLLLHSSFQDNHHDGDRDGFQDMPNRQTSSGLYRLFYWSDRLEGQFNVLAARDRRQGGQHTIHDHGQPVFDELYRINQASDNVEVFGKLGYMGFDAPYKSTGIIMSAAWRRLENNYGRKIHTGEQRSFYANWMYATIISNSDHQFNAGTTFQYDDIREQLNTLNTSRLERVAGIHGEYTYTFHQLEEGSGGIDELTAIAALRVDHHNLGGVQLTPRVNVKMAFSHHNALRLSAGRGWRSPNALVENLSWLVSSRQVVFDDLPELETAWNMGVSFTQEFMLNFREASVVAEAYRTSFQNQIVLDMEQNAEQLLFYHLDGASFSNSYLVQFTYELLRGLNVKLAHKWADVKTTYRAAGLRELPLVPRRRAMMALDYTTPNGKWMLSGTYHRTGAQRLPDHDVLPEGVSRYQPQVAPAYGLINAQLTWKASDRWEFYAGGENLTNQVQRRPIIGAEDPFGSYFDAGQVYAPTFGRRYHAGLRFTLAPASQTDVKTGHH